MTTRVNQPSTDHQPTIHSPINTLKRHIETADRQGPPPHQPRILIVEDHTETGILMQYALRECYRTEVVPTAGEALENAASTIYDGFLIDICLRSQRNGVDVLEALRTRESYRHAPMVAVTAHALPGDRERFLAAGFDDYLSKPFAADDLRAVLQRQMEARTLHSPALDNVPAE